MNASVVVAGIVGAVLGFIAALALAELAGFGNAADPILSGILALLVLGPAGAIVGLLLGVKAGAAMRGREIAFGRHVLGAGGILIGSVVAIGGLVSFYMYATATPWLNPNAPNPLLLLEVRLPPGVALPAAAPRIELQTDINTMPGTVRALRRDGDRAVVAGDVELAYRTANRQIALKIAGQPDRVFTIGLSGKAPHADAFGAWQKEADGSEIRYRARWPGRE